MAGAGAGLLLRSAKSILRAVPSPLKPLVRGGMRLLFDKVDLHSGEELMEGDDDGLDGPGSTSFGNGGAAGGGASPQQPASAPASIKELRAAMAQKVASRTDHGGGADGEVDASAVDDGGTAKNPPPEEHGDGDIFGRL